MTCISDLSARNREVNTLTSQLATCNTEKDNQRNTLLSEKLTLELKLTAERDQFKQEKDTVTAELLTFKDRAKQDQETAVKEKAAEIIRERDQFKQEKDAVTEELLSFKDTAKKDQDAAIEKKDKEFKALLETKDQDLKNKDQDLKDKDTTHSLNVATLKAEAEASQLRAETEMQKRCFSVAKDAFFDSRISDAMSSFLRGHDSSGARNTFDGTPEDFVRINMQDKQGEFIPQALADLEKKCGTFLSQPFAWYVPTPTGLAIEAPGTESKPVPNFTTDATQDSVEDDAEDDAPTTAPIAEKAPVVHTATADATDICYLNASASTVGQSHFDLP